MQDATDIPGLDPRMGTEEQHHRTQLGFARFLAKLQQERLLHANGIGWHYWNGKRWALDETGIAQRAVHTMLDAVWAEAKGDKVLYSAVIKLETASGVESILKIASTLPEFSIPGGDFDADPHLLNCENGTLDLREIEAGVRPHDPADLITKITRASYVAGTTSEGWTTFLKRVLPDTEVVEYLRRVLGLALLGKVIKHLFPILTGTGANGKGVFYETVCWALGDYATIGEPNLFLNREGSHPVSEMMLIGKRLVVVSESERGKAISEANMKRLTGGDDITARWMHKNWVTFKPNHLSLFITNHLPKVSGDDEATWRRMTVVPFDVVIPEDERIDGLAEILRAEADTVLAWMVAGYADYLQRDSKLDPPNQVSVRTAKYRRDSDPVMRFVEEECVTSTPARQATTGRLFEAWRKWVATEGVEEGSQKAFGMELDRLGYPVTSRTAKGRFRGGLDVKTHADRALDNDEGRDPNDA